MKTISFPSDHDEVNYIQLWIFKFKQKILLLNLENVLPSIDISQYHKAVTNRKATSPKRENLALNGHSRRYNKIQTTPFIPCPDTGWLPLIKSYIVLEKHSFKLFHR